MVAISTPSRASPDAKVAAQVVEAPRFREGHPRIERLFGLRPGTETAFAATEYPLVVTKPAERHFFNNLHRQRWKRQDVRPTILGPIAGDAQHGAIDLWPAKLTDFITSAPGQHQQLHDAAIIIVEASMPDRDEFAIAEYALASFDRRRCIRGDDWVCLDNAFLHRPSEKRPSGGPRISSRVRSVLRFNLGKPGGDLS